MGANTKIEWTRGDDGTPGATWNPVTGCTHVSEGCRNCYAERVLPRTGQSFDKVVCHPGRLDAPLHWKKPRRIFVNSLSDLFHPDVPASFITDCFEVMGACPHHTFQILTKRPERVESVLYGPDGNWFLGGNDWYPNIWLGFSAENQQTFDSRWACFGKWAYALNLFASLEPLLGPITCVFEHDTAQLRWVIVGGESGLGARPMHPDWARSLRDQCTAAGVPFFFKQWGNHCWPDQMTLETFRRIDAAVNLGNVPDDVYDVGKKAAGRLLDGRTWDELPKTKGVER